MEEGSKPFALLYRIYYKLLGTQLNPGAINYKEPSGKTMLIHCSTLDAEVQVPKMIQWQDNKLPTKWLLEQESPLTNLFLMRLLLLIFNNILMVLLK